MAEQEVSGVEENALAQCRNLLGNQPTPEGFCSRNREGHMPEVHMEIRKFEADIDFAVARALDRNNLPLGLLVRELIFEQQDCRSW